MPQAQRHIASLGVPEALRDHGRRSYRRLAPNGKLPATLSMVADSGWRLSRRDVRDISVGGASISVSFWEARRVVIAETVHLHFELGGTTVELTGRCVHMSGLSEWFVPRTVGIAFKFDGTYEQSSPALIEYLLHLVLRRN